MQKAPDPYCHFTNSPAHPSSSSMVTVADANAKVALAIGFVLLGFLLKRLGCVRLTDGEALL